MQAVEDRGLSQKISTEQIHKITEIALLKKRFFSSDLKGK